MPQIIKSKRAKKSPLPKKKLKKVLVVKSPKPSKVKHSPVDYYNCLMNYAQAGFYDSQEGKRQKIHSCCKKCKLSAPALNNKREQEVVKLITSYRQVGDSLAKLLKPVE
jgi:hypothetical protein